MASLDREKSIKAEMPALHPPTATTKRTQSILTIIGLLALTMISFFLSGFWTSTPQKRDAHMSWGGDDDYGVDIQTTHPKPEDKPFEPFKRYDLNLDNNVGCWSDGGVWMKSISAVEMAWLGVDRFQDTERAESQADEDEFCARFKMLGPTFWELPPRWPMYTSWCSTIKCARPTKQVNISTAFPPTGGVWILDSENERPYQQLQALRNALTMEERVDVIKDMGAYFCSDIDACLKPVFERSDQHRPAESGSESWM